VPAVKASHFQSLCRPDIGGLKALDLTACMDRGDLELIE